MKSKTLGFIVLIDLVLLVMWLAIMMFIYGVGLYLHGRPMRVAGGLLALSGAATLFIGVGVIAQLTQLVSASSMIGGVLSMASFVPLGVNLLRGEPDTPELQINEATG
jgi:hypothetical protein